MNGVSEKRMRLPKIPFVYNLNDRDTLANSSKHKYNSEYLKSEYLGIFTRDEHHRDSVKCLA